MLNQIINRVRRGGGIVVLIAFIVAVSAAMIPRGEVEVVLRDGEIAMGDSTAAGNAMFSIRNAGEQEHGFAIQTVGTEPVEIAALESPVAPGESAHLETVLGPGEYEIFCPVGDHKDQGMSRRLVVIEETR